MPKVWNRSDPNVPADAVLVDRTTPYGNPFSHLPPPDTIAIFRVGSRTEAIRKFREWVFTKPELIEQARRELAGKDLVCWCAPRPCHADVWLSIVNVPSLVVE
jgi:hypothetical protein